MEFLSQKSFCPIESVLYYLIFLVEKTLVEQETLDLQLAHCPDSFSPSQHPFSEENFAELLYAVQLLEESTDPEAFKTDYMLVVKSYFEQFNAKVSNENKTITPEVMHDHLQMIVVLPYSRKIWWGIKFGGLAV